METIATYFLLFMIYSFFGWIIEVINGLILRHKVSNRGFLIGPICPIYGVGSLLLTSILSGPEKNLLAVFCIGIVGGTTLEYLTSVIMEELFHVRWWDYSYMPFNLNGRICLQVALMFGLAAILINEITNPFFIGLINNITPNIRIIMAIILFVILITDICISFFLIRAFKVTVGTVSKDATDEISERVHNILMEKGKLSRRLVKAFPNFEAQSKKSDKKSQPNSN